jgi:hypothetical protein
MQSLYPTIAARWPMPCCACPCWILVGDTVAWVSPDGKDRVEAAHAWHCAPSAVKQAA